MRKRDREDFSCVVYVEGPRKTTVLIQKPGRLIFEFPGGKKELGENPRQAAARELAEETGLQLPSSAFQLVTKQSIRSWRKRWTLYLFQVVLQSYAGLRTVGTEGEFVSIHKQRDFVKRHDFHRRHYKLFSRSGLLPK